jgi:hypothetical protein
VSCWLGISPVPIGHSTAARTGTSARVVFAIPTLIPAARTVMAMVLCLLGTVLNEASRALGSYASYFRGEGCP